MGSIVKSSASQIKIPVIAHLSIAMRYEMATNGVLFRECCCNTVKDRLSCTFFSGTISIDSTSNVMDTHRVKRFLF